MGLESFDEYKELKTICIKIIQNQCDFESIKQLCTFLQNSESTFVKASQVLILSTFYPIIKNISNKQCSFKEDERRLLIDTLTVVFNKSIIDKIGLFFNIYALLLFEIYDSKNHLVLNIHEEYKLSIMQCMTALMKSVSHDLLDELYSSDNAKKLCQMLYVAVELSKKEQLRSLRISAVECIMSITRVLRDDDFNDVVVRHQIAEVTFFFLPGIASALMVLALEDEKVGHKLPLVAIKAWGRVVALFMQDYNAYDQKINSLKLVSTSTTADVPDNSDKSPSNKRSLEWYKENDKRLQMIVVEFFKLCHHSHEKVRLELAIMANILIENCVMTMPLSVSKLVDILIALTQDDYEEVACVSQTTLQKLSEKFSEEDLKVLFESLEEGFFNNINSLPRKFNGIDEKEQLASLNLLSGYISLFGKHKLNHVLVSPTYLNKLLLTLVHISELEKKDVSLLEEYVLQDLELTVQLKTPWKRFRYFTHESIELKLGNICTALSKYGTFRIVTDFLLDIFVYDFEHRKEATFLLNELLKDAELNEENIAVIKNIILTYIDDNNWNVPLQIMVDDLGYEHTLAEVQNNIIQVCLLLEGVGKVALLFKEKFREYLLRLLYLILERAGSGQSLIQAAGLSALSNVTVACGYTNITDLINGNIDYFSYHVERKLCKMEENENVLNVLAVVMRYSDITVLNSMANIVKEVLMQSCDKFKERNSMLFLRVFKMFVVNLHRWLKVTTNVEEIKSRAAKQDEEEHFRVSNIEENQSFSDEIMGNKTAEEMYKEDMKKSQQQIEEEIYEPPLQEITKPEPPLHIKLVVSIISRSLHFLPSKDRNKKLIVLEILNNGLEVIRDYEDELLPMVHQIWSPLVGRFKETNDPLIVHLSFNLLVTLSRLSKEFIRSRTSRDVLPNIIAVLNKLAQESYLKDKGSAYRYNQAYKLQLTLLEKIIRIVTDLDMEEEKILSVVDTVFTYVSDKQPIPLQVASLEFLKAINLYDSSVLKKRLNIWLDKHKNDEFEKNLTNLECFVNKSENT